MQKVDQLNPSIDIIPLQGSSGTCRSKSVDNKSCRMEHRIFRDQSLISRVQTYMSENENKVFIDVNDMADTLQRRYKDYRGKKRSAFRAMVHKAYDELIFKLFLKKPPHDGTTYDDYEDEVSVESDSQQSPIDCMLLQMYKKSVSKQNGDSSNKELIDISSDDDVAEVESKTDKETDKETETAHNENEEPSDMPSAAIQKEEALNDSVPEETPVKSKMPIKPETVIKPQTPTIEVKKQPPVEFSKKRSREKDNDSASFIVTKKTRSIPVAELKVTFSDVGGNEKVLKTVCKLLAHMKHPEIFKQLGISPPRGFLLHGPPGCGKTLLAHAVAGKLNMPLLKVAAPELIAGVSGESEARIRELFDQALALAPCVVFLDEIDAIAPNRATAQREMERRIVAQLLSCLDELNLKENAERVLVIGATNRPDSLDPALRRAGRFDREVCLGIPDKEARAQILTVHTKKLTLAPDVDLSRVAALTPGFVGADLVSLITEAAMAAVDRVFEQLNRSREMEKSNEAIKIDKQSDKEIPSERLKNAEKSEFIDRLMTFTPLESPESLPPSEKCNTASSVALSEPKTPSVPPSSLTFDWILSEPPLSSERMSMMCIENVDFEIALKNVQPSAKREGFVTVPDVTWEDVGSLQDIRQELQMAILAPVKHPEFFEALGLTAPAGILLCGPPGCGKTLLAKAIANEAGINFISVKGPELLNMYVGESEKAVRQCFLRARNSAPCVIFFDELDALCPKRSESESSATSRVVNQMLTEMDGVESRHGVFIMAASNRPDMIDAAVLRPGRLDKILYVGLPSAEERTEILRALTKCETKPKIARDVDLFQVGREAKGFTGADLAALIREAGMAALREGITSGWPLEPEICKRHISLAFGKLQPSVREEDLKHYEKLSILYSVKKNSEVTPMETPTDVPNDVIMEPMET